ncbi:glucoamylase family protein [Rubrivirga sp. IMCC43871]|uniref:glucoamylase family protein n=1 Tax=Rubrivirga sp. IMCC43871 TaxID=3391575 RepID=UPI00398F926F
MTEPPSDPSLLDAVHRASFAYFAQETNWANGLVVDSTVPDSPASIAAVGFALSALPVAVTRGWVTRAGAAQIALAAVRFFRDAPQSGAKDGVGHRGFFYHFLDMAEGRRAWNSELSTIDTAFLVAGLLCAAAFFDDADAAEAEIRAGAEAVYRAVDWDWARDGGDTVTMGWTPERGFLRYRWEGYTEALLLYALAAGSPTHPVPAGAFAASTRGYRWKRIYGHDVLYAGPLFIHQFSHLWVDLRGVRDAAMRAASARLGAPTDYFENSRRSTLIHREYARRNPRGFAGYGADAWGLTASDGPGPGVLTVDGRERRFWGYRARGAPFGPDDGTLAPWAALASLPFAPEAVLDCLHCLARTHEAREDRFGFEASFNPTFPDGGGPLGWVSEHHYALNQGPIVLAVENHRSGLVWDLMRTVGPLAVGLQRCGFEGGWLDGVSGEK